MKHERNEEGLFEVLIEDQHYQFSKWGAEEALEHLLKLAKLIGKPLGLALTAFKSEEEGKGLLDKEVKLDVIGMALGALAENMNEEMTMAMLKKFSTYKVLCEGAKINFNHHYEDRLHMVFLVTKAALEVQYGNFLSAVLGSQGKNPLKGIMNQVSRT